MSRHLTLQQIAASVDDELSGVARELVERHLSSCAGCDAVMERVVHLDAELLAVIADSPGDEFFDEMLAVIRGKTEAIVEQAAAEREAALAQEAIGAAERVTAVAADARSEPVEHLPAGATPVSAAPRPHVPAEPMRPARPVARHLPRPVPSRGSRLSRALVAATGVLLVPLAAFIVFAILNARQVRERGDVRTVSAGGAATANRPAPDTESPALEPAVTDPLGLQPVSAPLPMTPAFVESGGVVPESAPPAPAAQAPRTSARARRVEPEPPVAHQASAAGPWSTRRVTHVATPTVPPPVPDLGLLCGEVRDFDGRPVASAQVEISEAMVVVVTDAAGRFCMSAPAGDRTMTVRAPGFVAQQTTLRVGPQTPAQILTLSALR